MSALGRPPLIDTHAHVQDPRFDGDRAQVLARAAAAGVRALICVGYDLPSSRAAVALAAADSQVFATVGMHPNASGEASAADWDELRELARRPRVVGLGETGLDNYRKRTAPAIQEAWLERHLDLARETDLPVVIHNREADSRLRDLLRAWRGARSNERPPGVMHCFSGDRAMLEASLDLGFAISFAGTVTFKNAHSLQSVAKLVPADSLVIETDCPYLTPHPHRGQRNEPAYVAQTARWLAELREVPFEQLAQQSSRNAARLFGLPVPTISSEQGAVTP